MQWIQRRLKRQRNYGGATQRVYVCRLIVSTSAYIASAYATCCVRSCGERDGNMSWGTIGNPKLLRITIVDRKIVKMNSNIAIVQAVYREKLLGTTQNYSISPCWCFFSVGFSFHFFSLWSLCPASAFPSPYTFGMRSTARFAYVRMCYRARVISSWPHFVSSW